MNDIKPIKRSVSLQPLSREHHDGLLFVWKIRQGLNNHTPIDKLQRFVRWFWKNHIRPHFFQEEKILLPYLPASHPLVDKIKNDHEDILELMLSIDKDVNPDDLSRLSTLIEAHIRFEEREFFQYIEDHLSEQQLTIVYQQLEKHPVLCEEEWKDEFWVRA